MTGLRANTRNPRTAIADNLGDLGVRLDPYSSADREPFKCVDDLRESSRWMEHAVAQVETAHQVIHSGSLQGVCSKKNCGVLEDLAQDGVTELAIDESVEAST